MKAVITTHVLNLDTGRPAQDLEVTIYRTNGQEWQLLDKATTDEDGRISDWLSGYTLEPGNYSIVFQTGNYFQQAQQQTFYPRVVIEFSVADTDEHYHVPLLLNRHGYSTYRGS